MNDECSKWTELSDRQALEGALSREDAEFLTAHVTSCAACASEQQVFAQLRTCLDGSPRESRGAQNGARHVLSLTPARRPRRLDTKGRWFVAAGALVLASIAGWGALSTTQENEPPQELAKSPTHAQDFAHLLLVSGEVTMGGHEPTAGASLREEEAIATAEGRACLMHGSATTCLEAQSRGRILAARAGAARVELTQGTLVCRQASTKAGDAFEVKTKWGTLIGMGAEFVTAYTGEGLSVEVTTGRLRVEPKVGNELVLEGKHHVHLDASGVSQRDLRATDDERFLEMQMWDQLSLSPVTLSSQPPGSTVRIDGIIRGVTPFSMMIARGTHHLSLEQNGFKRAERLLEVKGAERVVTEIELSRLPDEKKAQSARSSAPSELLEKAQNQRKNGQYADAARTYQALLSAYPSSREASATRLSLGELQLSKLGAPGAALDSFRRYLKSGGALRQEASYGEIRALRALGRDAEARQIAQRFVSIYPESGQAVSLKQWLGASSSPALK
jgi:hypothetical protein